ncbi:MAG: VOC family protein [Candidatus Bipolaricaulota bacterium]
MFGELEHIGIAAKNVEALSAWYVEALGYQVAYRDPKTGTQFLKHGRRSMLEVTPANDVPRKPRDMKDAGLIHLAIWTDDFDRSYAALKARGVKFVSPVDEEPGVKKVVFFEDPEGNLLHLMYRPTPLG